MRTLLHLTAAVALVLTCAHLSGADWPGFRGANTDGVSAEKDLPVRWSGDNFLWKLKLPGLGTSSPIVHGEQVFLTCYAGYGTKLSRGFGGFGKGGFGKGGFGKGGFGGDTGGDQKKLKLLVVSVDRNKGTVQWSKEIQPKLPEASFSGFLRDHGYASSTPVTDGERVYVFFGKTGVLAFDLQGKQLWQSSVGTGTDKWGSAASPVLSRKTVIVNASIESRALVGLDRITGKELWRRKGISTSWSSPIVVTLEGGKQEVVLSAPGTIHGLDPDTGEELWHCQGIGGGDKGYTICTPVAKDGIVYVMGGGATIPSTLLAVRAGGRGDVTKMNLLWKQRAGASVCSPVVYDGRVFWVNGSLNCLDAKTGKIIYQERVYDSRSEYTSPVVADGKLFALTRFNGLYVLGTGEKFEKLAHNNFSGDDSIFNSSPAVSNSRLYIRSNEYLYCIGKQ